MTEALSRLELVLEAQRRMILTGDFDGLFDLTSEIGTLVGEIERTAPDHEAQQRLKSAAARNGDLLLAGKRGFRSVERRLKEVSEAAHSLRTYTRDGRPERILKAVPSGRTF